MDESQSWKDKVDGELDGGRNVQTVRLILVA